MSVLEVLGVEGNVARVRGLDIRDGTSILQREAKVLTRVRS